MLLRSYEHASGNNPAYLILVGRDMDTPENNRILEKSNKKNRVIFTGFRSDALRLTAGVMFLYYLHYLANQSLKL
ncbi:MAG: hypothetical protein R2850_00100 [Bacteroidia bacterium]